MTIDIALIDDLPQDLESLRRAVSESCTARGDRARIACYSDGPTALADAGSGRLRADLVFVDVMMPEQSGVELIPELRRLLPKGCLFVLTSSNHGYIRAGYGIEAFDFLCKPILGPELREVLDRAARKLRFQSGGVFCFHADRTEHRLDYDDILMISMERNYAIVTTRTKTYSLRTTMKDLTEQLPERFIQCARGKLINITNVSAISRTDASFDRSDLRVKISRQYFDAVYEAFNAMN